MFSFAWPWMILLAPLPFLVRWLLPVAPRTEGNTPPEITFPHMGRLTAAFSGFSVGQNPNSGWQIVIISIVWLCLIAALMRPQLVDQSTEVKTIGRDLMLAVDLSGSMHALDFATQDERVNRLDVIKAVVGKFVRERKGDRVGLVLFGSNAYLRVPLTFDTLSVSKMLDDMQIGEAGDSTAIGDAIGLAVQNLRDRPAQSRVLVLLTDGADNASTIPPLQAAKLAAQYGIRIYTIGIGSHGPVPIPDEDGNIVMAEMDLDEDLLRKIADITGGSYFHATQTSTLETVYDKINAMEATESEERTYLIRKPLYTYPLGTAMAFLMVLGLTPLGRRAIHGI